MLTTSNNTKTPVRIEGIQPILAVKDINASRAFYIGIFGFSGKRKMNLQCRLQYSSR